VIMIPRYDSPLMPATQTFSVECDAALEDLKFSACQMTDLRKRIIWLGLYSTFLPGKVGACVTNVMARFAHAVVSSRRYATQNALIIKEDLFEIAQKRNCQDSFALR